MKCSVNFHNQVTKYSNIIFCIENALSFCLFSETYYDKSCLECDIIILIIHGLEMPQK